MKIIALIIMFLASAAVQSETPTAITLGSTDQAPWAWLNEQHQLQGATLDFAKQLERRLDIKVNAHAYPYARLLQYMQHEKLDLALMLESDQQQGSIPVAMVLEVDVQLTSIKKLSATAISELGPYKIGKIVGGKYDKGLNNILPEDYFIPLNSYRQGLELLQKNRLDAIFGLAFSINEAVEKYAIQPNQLHHQQLFKEEIWLYASATFKAKPGLISDIQNNVQDMRSKGELKSIAQRSYIKSKNTFH